MVSICWTLCGFWCCCCLVVLIFFLINKISCAPAGTWRLYNVALTSMQRHDVIHYITSKQRRDIVLTLMLRCISAMWLLCVSVLQDDWTTHTTWTLTRLGHNFDNSFPLLQQVALFICICTVHCHQDSIYLYHGYYNILEYCLSFRAGWAKFIMPKCFQRTLPSGASAGYIVQSTLVISNSKGLWNTSRYPYLDISDLENWGKNNLINHI